MADSSLTILVAGPIGSGKTTTLYACLRATTVPERCLITIEDPIEYHIDGATQIEINTKSGQSFGGSLRSAMSVNSPGWLITL